LIGRAILEKNQRGGYLYLYLSISTAVFIKSQHYFESILKIPLILQIFSDSLVAFPCHKSAYNISAGDGLTQSGLGSGGGFTSAGVNRPSFTPSRDRLSEYECPLST
jgi:hypothetical protein